jgi:hypothetical protein
MKKKREYFKILRNIRLKILNIKPSIASPLVVAVECSCSVCGGVQIRGSDRGY